MKTLRPRRGLTALLLALAALPAAAAEGGDIVVRGQRVFPVSGPAIEDGVVVVRDGRITAVGPADRVAIPTDLPVRRAAVVVPGLVDARTVVGLSGQYNVDTDQDQLDGGAPLQPELRAVDGYNPRERLVAWVASLGVTTVHTGHAPGAVISGQTMVVKTVPGPVDEHLLVPEAMVAATLGPGAQAEGREAPGTGPKGVAMLRAQLIAADAWRTRRDAAAADDDKTAPDRDLGLETLAAVLDGRRPLLVTAHRSQDILTALRLREEFGIPMVLDGASEAYLVLDQIRAAGVSVIVHPTMQRAGGLWDAAETVNATMRNAALVRAAGIPMALQSGFESYVPKTRVVLFEAGVATAYGLAWADALAAITLDAARLLGVDDRVGSLEVGKDGDLALYDGDPFEYTTHCVGTIIDGHVVSDVVR